MNLLAELKKTQTQARRSKIVDYIGNDADRFAALILVFLAGPYRITQRATWPLTYCVERNPELIKPHLKAIVHHLKVPDAPDAVIRNIIRLLQFIAIPRFLQGEVAGLCFDFFIKPRTPVAIKVFSMTVLANIAIEMPDLKQELRIMIEDQRPFASAAFLSRARKVLNRLKP